MGDGEWLSTRNRKKVTQPQPRIQKRRISTSKSMKSTCLQVSHSPPPRQLFTATKQSSLNDFFSTSEDHDREVNFEDDSQNRRLDQITTRVNSVFSKTEKSSKFRKPEQKECDNLGTDMFERNRRYDDNRIFEKESENSIVNIFKLDAKVREVKEITSEHIPISVDEKVKEIKGKFEELEKVNDVLNNFEDTDRNPETEESSCPLGYIESVNRKRCVSELSNDLGPSVKRNRTDGIVFENDLELTNNTTRDNRIESVELNKNSEQTSASYSRTTKLEQDSTEDPGRFTECDVTSQDLSIPDSFLRNQSLLLESQLSLTSQQSVLETGYTLTIDTEKDVKASRLENTDLLELESSQEETGTELLEKDLIGNSLSLSSQAKGVDSASLDIPFTLSSQRENGEKKYEQLMLSTSLDLSDQSDMLYVGTEGTEHCVIAPNKLETDSQLSFESSSLGQLLEYESLQLP